MDQHIELFEPDGREESEDLPWVKDYYKSAPNQSEIMELISVTPCEKGLFYLTTSAKGFIFKREKEYVYILEALEQWVKTSKEVSPLILTRVSKRIVFGLDHKKPKVRWFKESDTRYVSRQVEPPTSQAWLPKRNPFLSDSPAHAEEAPNLAPQGEKKKKISSAQESQGG